MAELRLLYATRLPLRQMLSQWQCVSRSYCKWGCQPPLPSSTSCYNSFSFPVNVIGLDLFCFNFPGTNLKMGYEKTSICVQDGSPQEIIHFDFLHSEACNPSPHFLCTAKVLFRTANYSNPLVTQTCVKCFTAAFLSEYLSWEGD